MVKDLYRIVDKLILLPSAHPQMANLPDFGNADNDFKKYISKPKSHAPLVRTAGLSEW
jgi:hypothetical protein